MVRLEERLLCVGTPTSTRSADLKDFVIQSFDDAEIDKGKEFSLIIFPKEIFTLFCRNNMYNFLVSDRSLTNFLNMGDIV